MIIYDYQGVVMNMWEELGEVKEVAKSKVTISVCLGSSCHLKGAYRLVEKIKEAFNDPQVELRGSLCMGNCAEGVNIRIDDEMISNVSDVNIDSVIERIRGISKSRKAGEKSDKE